MEEVNETSNPDMDKLHAMLELQYKSLRARVYDHDRKIKLY